MPIPTPIPVSATLAAPAMAQTHCPYCAHVSPLGSKFCNECGAALHLLPCPHCGAVNDITLMSVCARCNGDLRPALDSLAAEPTTAAADPPDEVPIEQAPVTGDRKPPSLPHATPLATPLAALFAMLFAKWPRRLRVGAGVGLALVAAAATLGWYSGTKRLNSEAQPMPAALTAGATGSIPAVARVSTPLSERVSEPVSEPVALSATAAPVSRPTVRPHALSKVDLQTISPPVRAAPPGPQDLRSTRDTEPRPAVIGPCTDAVAALGLCNSDSNNSRRP